MISRNFLSSCLVLMSLFSFAQTIDRKVSLGFTGGVSFNSFMSANAPHKDFPEYAISNGSGVVTTYGAYNYSGNVIGIHRFGFVFGLTAEKQITQKNWLAMNLTYQQKGISLSYSDQSTASAAQGEQINARGLTCDIKNNYLVLYVLMKRRLGTAQRFHIAYGPYLGRLTKSDVNETRYQMETVNGQTTSSSSTTVHVSGSTARQHTANVDFGLTAGGGFQVPLTQRLKFNFDMLFNVGLIDLDSKYNNDYTQNGGVVVKNNNYYGLNSHAKNVSLTATAGLAYSL